ncbi:MAG TPA: hypothetical protein DDW88_01390 [Treponema sp.]|nr:hypothetical protein [Treponema sp.]
MYVIKEPLSYGQRLLLNLVDERRLRSFCTEREIPFHYTYRVATGKQTPPPTLIWSLRDYIHPALWFYDEGEPYEIIPFQVKRKEENPNKTIAMKDFREYAFQDLKDLSKKHSIKFYTLYNIHIGKYVPSFLAIKQFMKLYKPELWFMYAEEKQ